MPEDLPEGVAETAIGAAMMRARETARVDRLFDDPYAADFVAAVSSIFANGPTREDDPAIAELEAAFEEVVAVRTRFFDDFVTDAAAAGCRQVVLVGAGLDTRAFRLDWPEGSRLFELDLPEVLSFKDSVLAKNAAQCRCERVTVAVDLQQHGWPVAVLEEGFEPTRPTAWVVEGVVPYLTNDDAERLLVAVDGLSSPDSRLALDHAGAGDDEALRRARSMPSMDEITSMWHGGLTEGASTWLSHHGWETRAVHGKALGWRYGRHADASEHGLHGVLVTARRLHPHPGDLDDPTTP